MWGGMGGVGGGSEGQSDRDEGLRAHEYGSFWQDADSVPIGRSVLDSVPPWVDAALVSTFNSYSTQNYQCIFHGWPGCSESAPPTHCSILLLIRTDSADGH